MVNIVEEIVTEAARQKAEHPHDIHSAGHGMQSRYRWVARMLDRLARSDDAGPDAFRQGMVSLAALCLRAIEAFDTGKKSISYESREDDTDEDADNGPPSSRR